MYLLESLSKVKMPSPTNRALNASAASFVPFGTASSGGDVKGTSLSPGRAYSGDPRPRSNSLGSVKTNTSTSAAIDHFSEYMYDEQMYEVTKDEAMDALEDEMEKDERIFVEMGGISYSGGGGAPSSSSSGLPAHLASGAAEFWFPECRNCGCCKGYKHGCICGGLCKCARNTKESVASEAFRVGVLGTKQTEQQRSTSATQTAFAAKSKQSLPLCQHYQRGSCRYGDQCRFSHS